MVDVFNNGQRKWCDFNDIHISYSGHKIELKSNCESI